MPIDPNLTVHLGADVTDTVEKLTTAQMNILSTETGLTAAAWREAHDLAGDRELFERAVKIWRDSDGGGPAAESPADIVHMLQSSLKADS